MQGRDCYERQDSGYLGGREGTVNCMGHIEGLLR